MKNVLIVDDDIEIRNIIEEYLNRILGSTHVTISQDGIEAFMSSSMQKYDIIILDHQMPRLRGIDLLVALRNKAGPNKDTPIIVISAHIPELPGPLDEFKNTFFLGKPFDFNGMSHYLEMALK